MFAVDRQELDALLLRKRRHQLTGHDHHFLGGECNVHALLDRGDRGAQSGHADCSNEADVSIILLDGPQGGVLADIGLRAELPRQGLALLLRMQSRNRDDPEIVGMGSHDIDRTGADRSRRPEENEPLRHENFGILYHKLSHPRQSDPIYRSCRLKESVKPSLA